MATKRASAKMPPLKHALVLQAELETLKVHVEALRHCLAELAAGAEVLLRESNPLNATTIKVDKLVWRAESILRTYASAQVRAHYDLLEGDKRLLDFLEHEVHSVIRGEDGWLVHVRQGLSVKQSAPLRQVLRRAYDEAEVPF